MRNLILAGAAALAFAVPAAAQETVAVDAEGNVYVLTAPQKVMYDSWPAERRVMYDAWPMGVQEYYWTLDPMQVEGWWVLDDAQRVRIYEMTPEARVAAWTSIAAQMNGAAPMASTTATMATTAAASASTMPPRFVSSEVVQPTTDAPVAAGAEVPICKPEQQDNCINSWEARKTGNRPLNYWPGKPASEIDTPLPADDPND